MAAATSMMLPDRLAALVRRHRDYYLNPYERLRNHGQFDHDVIGREALEIVQ